MDSNAVAGESSEHPDAEVEAAWAAEAHRRWKAYQRGDEEMLDFDDVMAEIRDGFRDRREVERQTVPSEHS